MEAHDWQALPKEVLFLIFRDLSFGDIRSIRLTCKSWYDGTQDNLLWKAFFRRDFQLTKEKLDEVDKMSKVDNWEDEYRNIFDNSPKVLSTILNNHADEVLSVTFSRDGKDLVSCSKDAKFIVWKQQANEDYTFSQSHDMRRFEWMHTWSGQFSENDERLLVTGVMDRARGEIAIFSTGKLGGKLVSNEYQYLCRVMNDPYDVIGCWLTNDLFVAGSTTFMGFNELEVTMWLYRVVETPAEAIHNVNIDNIVKDLVPFEDQGVSYFRFLRCHFRLKYHDSDLKILGPMPKGAGMDNRTEGLPDLTLTGCDPCLIFLCGYETAVPHQIGFQRVDVTTISTDRRVPEKMIDFHGHIISMAMDKKEEFLYVNVRAWPSGTRPTFLSTLPISNQVTVHVVNLETFEVVPNKTYAGHIGYTSSEETFYLYMDTSENMLTSGSEDKRGCLWHRKYDNLLARLEHGACVNCIVINPVDEEICASASDDHTIRIWKSRRKMRAESSSKE